ncbi:hypothetical protein pEaSNUABM50_00211 [Erwinia phage pEa_SNUABM_50]|uniref:Uncharacterized protein n=4 Tax=Eneladusvirus BF TaxID=2560751 RepID=A0A7L8ZMI8_9CAUD|nr:hypothetical protein FDH34_gp215 [Serratia phage BF]QOI71152.1 hypothetical protein pEaSNUABM12_00214 [Erwinia phage pEa_SNUABM_12]QOI71696.1 hypothetical protein pEaSNUABM47_00212 [Erwinia phage pEa_SNUABM_47]QOI72235.1 hypothetical protein pEaSNUABM50_00211 [Erwinia phage pEa_SNUABM_50]QXO11361.1 hypothetical protein pEaSNUABM19_00215 [Erwinia phage pEa_SNUABM_19]QXO11909.1 hypothetical protein pEaSNUABM44_00213 [Erwinia phage pEa_SNUABM_44]QXO12461.1 hypothetical protein pEaSNUABM49_002
MSIIRHCGVVRSTGSRVFVVWRQLENDPQHCLVVYRDSLPEAYVNKVTDLVLNQGQSSIDLWNVIDKIGMLEGTNMLTLLHKMGYIRKQNTQDIDMHVGGNNKIPLNVLNNEIDSAPEMVSGTVKDFNPFDRTEVQYPEQNTVVTHLLDDARKYEQLSRESFERAYNLDPSLRPQATVGESQDDGFIHLRIDPSMSQTKAIELVKKTLKEHKDAE